MNPEIENRHRILQLERKLRKAGSNVDNTKVMRLTYIYNKPLVIKEVTTKTAENEPVL